MPPVSSGVSLSAAAVMCSIGDAGKFGICSVFVFLEAELRDKVCRAPEVMLVVCTVKIKISVPLKGWILVSEADYIRSSGGS